MGSQFGQSWKAGWQATGLSTKMAPTSQCKPMRSALSAVNGTALYEATTAIFIAQVGSRAERGQGRLACLR